MDVQKNDLAVCIVKTKTAIKINKNAFEELYKKYNRKEFISPDPLQFLWEYSDRSDREIVGLVASALAYGRVAQILKSIESILKFIGKPSLFVKNVSLTDMRKIFKTFKHRFNTGDDIAGMLFNSGKAIEKHGSLEDCFFYALKRANYQMIPAMALFVKELSLHKSVCRHNLLPSPSRGSACKRLNLFLRWMVRNDKVDPGVWRKIPASMLIIPLDTHMDNICRTLGITRRKQANMKTAIEITDFFKDINAEDPVKYDFSLTRLGIIDRSEFREFLKKWRI